MSKGRRIKEGEKLDDSTVERVISLLEGTSPITKKAACEILNITYNTKRLDSIISSYKESREKEAKLRAEKRGKPATTGEISFVISSYLEGGSVDHIAKAIYRGTPFVNKILDENSVPRRAKAYNYFRPEIVPDGAMRDKFSIGEKVYSMQYDSLAKIDAEMPHKIYGNIYRVWLLSDKWQQFAHCPACELASLEHLVKMGVPL
jgi:predicted Zn-ribbon and HTH transcriptional regulator